MLWTKSMLENTMTNYVISLNCKELDTPFFQGTSVHKHMKTSWATFLITTLCCMVASTKTAIQTSSTLKSSVQISFTLRALPLPSHYFSSFGEFPPCRLLPFQLYQLVWEDCQAYPPLPIDITFIWGHLNSILVVNRVSKAPSLPPEVS